jgi:CheY-like chemotaxis protein
MDLAKVKALAHQWAGEGGTFGYPEISLRSKVVELLADATPVDLAGIRSRLEELANLFSPSATEPEVPEAVSRALARKEIGVLGFHEPMAGRIAGLLRSAGATVSVSPASDMRRFHLLVIRAGAPRQEVAAWSEMEQPLLVIGSGYELLDYQTLVRSERCEFVDANWEPQDLLLRTCLALNKFHQQAPAVRDAVASGIPKIVLADDDGTIVAMLSSLLKNYGMECETASDGAAALERIRQLKPAAAVVDVNMPGLDGFEVLAALKNDSQTRGVKVILLTARQQETDILRGFGLGASDYVVKPFSPMELLARIRRLL